MAGRVVLNNVSSGTLSSLLKAASDSVVIRCSAGSVLVKMDVVTNVSPYTGTTYHTVVAGEGVIVDTSAGDTILLEAASASTTATFGERYNR